MPRCKVCPDDVNNELVLQEDDRGGRYLQCPHCLQYYMESGAQLKPMTGISTDDQLGGIPLDLTGLSDGEGLVYDETEGQFESSAAGMGDMIKTTYDTNDDGVVDGADDSALLDGNTLAQVRNHSPISHNHTESDITDLDHYDSTDFDTDFGGKSIADLGTKNHSDLTDDEATKHRLINDSGTGATELWSASKVNTELGGKSDTGHTHTEGDITDLDHYDSTDFDTDFGSADLVNLGTKNHSDLTDDEATKHRLINDSGTSATELWSASKINTELGGKSDTGHTHTESDVTDLDHDDTDAIHDNVAGEIAAVSEKGTPVSADVVLIEDSADSNNKKKAQLGNLPTNSHTHTESDITDLDHYDSTDFNTDFGSADLANLGTKDHSDLNDDEATKHRLINDSGTSATELWSASKINTELGGKSDTGHTHTESDVTDLDHDDTDAIHDNVAGEISAVSEKATPVSADLVLLEDSADSNNKKKAQVGNLPVGSHTHTESDVTDLDHYDSTDFNTDFGSADLANLGTKDHSDLNDDEATKHRLINDSGTSATELWSASKINTELGGKSDTGHTHTESDVTDLDHDDTDAIHDNVAGEINAVSEKGTPVSGDLLLIEDSADSNNKKKVQVGNLPGLGSDDDAIHDNVAGEIAAISEKGTPVSADVVVIEDSADSNNKKKAQLGNLPVGSHTHTESDVTDLDHDDTDAIHDNVAGEINAVSEKGSPVSGDLLLIEDSADSNNKKKVQVGNLPGLGSDDDAIHDNVASEISAISEKGTPVSADLLLIEDSADSNNKKKIQIGNLPGGGGLEVGCRVYLSTDYTAATGGDRQIPFDTEFYDIGSDFSSNTFDVPENGYYLVQLIVRFTDTLADGDECQAVIKAGSTVLVRSTLMVAGAHAPTVQASMVCYLTSAQYVSFYVRHDAGVDKDIKSGDEYTIATVTKLG